MSKKWRGSEQVRILHGKTRELYAVHATQLLLTGQVYPMLMSSVPYAWGIRQDPFKRPPLLYKDPYSTHQIHYRNTKDVL